MKWSIKIGRLWGIDVFLHVTFLLFLAWVAYSTGVGNGVGAAVSAVILLLSLFSCVLLHEYGHALTARRFGIGTHDITLLPIGGVARLVSWATHGAPAPLVVVLAASELLIPPLLLIWYAKVKNET